MTELSARLERQEIAPALPLNKWAVHCPVRDCGMNFGTVEDVKLTHDPDGRHGVRFRRPDGWDVKDGVWGLTDGAREKRLHGHPSGRNRRRSNPYSADVLIALPLRARCPRCGRLMTVEQPIERSALQLRG